jgi:hypothetical protein
MPVPRFRKCARSFSCDVRKSEVIFARALREVGVEIKASEPTSKRRKAERSQSIIPLDIVAHTGNIARVLMKKHERDGNGRMILHSGAAHAP